jgi:hypothetical protein
MASKGKKTDRDLAIDALVRRSRLRADSNELWNLIISAEDSLIGEKQSGGLAATMLLGDSQRPIADATFVLTISAAIEQALEMAISTHFVLDDEGCRRMFDDTSNGSLATFASKIKMGLALGIYQKGVRDELDMIRHIRNLFAHSKEKLDFSSQEIVDGCFALRIPTHYVSQGIKEPKTPRVRFVISARVLFVYFEYTEAPKPMRYKTHPMRGEFFSKLEDAPEPHKNGQSQPPTSS